jgi:hypothetical protein
MVIKLLFLKNMKHIFMFVISIRLISIVHGYFPRYQHLRLHNTQFKRDQNSPNDLVKIGNF